MGLLLSTRRALLGGVGDYNDLVLGTGPIAYWPQNEPTGTTANCLVNPAQNGSYTGVTLANDATGPFKMPAPFYDGTNDYCNIFSAAFDAAFNGATGTAMIWARVNAAGVWTDAADRRATNIYDDADNSYNFQKPAAVNRVATRGEAGTGFALITHTPFTDTAWFCMVVTWSDSNNADELRFYVNATQRGATSAALNAWNGGGLDNTRTVIGAINTTPAQVWHGWLGPCAIWDTVLPQATITALYNC